MAGFRLKYDFQLQKKWLLLMRGVFSNPLEIYQTKPYVTLFQKYITGLIILTSSIFLIVSGILFLLHTHHLNEQYVEKHTRQANLIKQIIQSVDERLNFLEKRFEKVSLHALPEAIKKMPSLSNDLMSDVVVFAEGDKYTRFGKTKPLKADAQYLRAGVFVDNFGHLVFGRRSETQYFIFRVSNSSLAKALESKALHFKAYQKQNSYKISSTLWLQTSLKQAPLWNSFWEKYWLHIIFIAALILLLVFLFVTMFLHISLATRKKYKEATSTQMQNIQDITKYNLKLTSENGEYKRLEVALKKKYKMQADWIIELQSRRLNLVSKISDISRLTARSFNGPDHILDEREISRLLGEIAKSADELMDNIIVIRDVPSVSLKHILKEVEQYLSWNLMRSGITLTIEVEGHSQLSFDGFALTVLLVNVLALKISKVYEGACISVHASQTSDSFEIDCSCSEILETKGKYTIDLQANPFILSTSAVTTQG